jgi:hypothetical protein
LLPNTYVGAGVVGVSRQRVKRIEVHPNKVYVIDKNGDKIEFNVTDVRRLATCPSHKGQTHALVVRGGVLYEAEELSFKGVVWVEREEKETGCVVYERPKFESAAKLLLELSRKLKEVSELLTRAEIVQLVEFYEQHKRCSTEYTWVLNPIGKKYWYWYLKCPSGYIKSIYLGKNPGFYEARMAAARAVTEVHSKLSKLDLRGMAEELESAATKLGLAELGEAATAKEEDR